MTRQRHPRPNPQAQAETHLHPKVLAREAAKVAADLGLRLTPARIRLLVKAYLGSGHASTTGFRDWFLTYADPTGEQAVRHVDRERAR